jgi:hypothetical protein
VSYRGTAKLRVSAGAPVQAGRICWLPGEAGGEGAGGWRPWPMRAALSPLTTVGTGGVEVRLIVVLFIRVHPTCDRLYRL